MFSAVPCNAPDPPKREQRRANEELARVNRDLEAFAYAASHDLQEPLRTVKIFSEQLVRLYDNQGQNAEQYVGFVRQGVTRMEQLIRDLLDSRVLHTPTEHQPRVPQI
jgi:light-regulated signal transduction histidine kinase (bacteriophytochrome)